MANRRWQLTLSPHKAYGNSVNGKQAMAAHTHTQQVMVAAHTNGNALMRAVPVGRGMGVGTAVGSSSRGGGVCVATSGDAGRLTTAVGSSPRGGGVCVAAGCGAGKLTAAVRGGCVAAACVTSQDNAHLGSGWHGGYVGAGCSAGELTAGEGSTPRGGGGCGYVGAGCSAGELTAAEGSTPRGGGGCGCVGAGCSAGELTAAEGSTPRGIESIEPRQNLKSNLVHATVPQQRQRLCAAHHSSGRLMRMRIRSSIASK